MTELIVPLAHDSSGHASQRKQPLSPIRSGHNRKIIIVDGERILPPSCILFTGMTGMVVIIPSKCTIWRSSLKDSGAIEMLPVIGAVERCGGLRFVHLTLYPSHHFGTNSRFRIVIPRIDHLFGRTEGGHLVESGYLLLTAEGMGEGHQNEFALEVVAVVEIIDHVGNLQGTNSRGARCHLKVVRVGSRNSLPIVAGVRTGDGDDVEIIGFG